MKQVFYNPKKADQESKEAKKAKLESEKRKKFFDNLRENKNFVKYVIDGIVRKEIEKAQTSPTNIQGIDIAVATPEVVKSALVEKSGALKASQSILNQILNG